MDDSVVIWEVCEMCEDFFCNIHNEHAADCECPGIDTWIEAGIDPYLDEADEMAHRFVQDNPFVDE